MDIARNKMSKELFDEIYASAVAKERKAVLKEPVVEKINKPHLASVMTAHLNNSVVTEKPISHISDRLEERFDLQVGPHELGKLSAMIKNGGQNVVIKRRRFDAIIECEVMFLGKHFTCIYNQTRNVLITAYPKTKKKKKVQVGKSEKNWRRQMEDILSEED